ncbi:MAG: hypothetical protein LBP76_04315 [Treponema sp.]|jgi:hypothetical protein|nr:hypothetical protein [Treponema sp.]
MKKPVISLIMLLALIWCADAQTDDVWYTFQLKYSDTSIYAMLVFAPDGNITRATEQIALSIRSDLNAIGEGNLSSRQRQWVQSRLGKLEQLKQYTDDRGRRYLADSINNEINRQPWAPKNRDVQASDSQTVNTLRRVPLPPVRPVPALPRPAVPSRQADKPDASQQSQVPAPPARPAPVLPRPAIPSRQADKPDASQQTQVPVPPVRPAPVLPRPAIPSRQADKPDASQQTQVPAPPARPAAPRRAPSQSIQPQGPDTPEAVPAASARPSPPVRR